MVDFALAVTQICKCFVALVYVSMVVVRMRCAICASSIYNSISFVYSYARCIERKLSIYVRAESAMLAAEQAG